MKETDTVGSLSAIFTKEDYFCGSLLALLHAQPLL